MAFTDARDNITDIEASLTAADAHADTREDTTTWSECGCEDCTAPSLGSEVYAEHMADFYG